MKLLLTLLAASVLLAAPAAAQQQPPTRPERPYRGLFGGGVGNAEQLLTVNLSLGGGYDDNVLADPAVSGGGGGDPRRSRGGSIGTAGAQLTYSLSRTRAGVNASIGTSSRYYPDMNDRSLGSHSGRVGAFLHLGQGTRLVASHSTSYQPFLTLGLFPQLLETPGPATPLNPEFEIERSDYFNHRSTVDLTQSVSRRGSLSVNYQRQLSDFKSADRDFSSHGGGARFSLGLSRGLGIRIGYGYTDALFSARGEGAVQGHNIDVGFDYSRPLSFSRRTTVSFGSGSAIIRDRDRNHYRLLANGTISHEIGRTWNASVAYARTAGFVEALSGPVFSDAVTLAYGGMISRQLQLLSRASASVGDFTFTGAPSGFDTFTGSVGLTYGLTRNLGLGLQYSYYRYDFDQGAPLPTGVARNMDRQSLQANVNLWMPVVHRARREDASR